jgi:hypothetical protein
VLNWACKPVQNRGRLPENFGIVTEWSSVRFIESWTDMCISKQMDGRTGKQIDKDMSLRVKDLSAKAGT